ncbi:MAG: DNA-directed DNA polymerase II small subunit [Candidatus Diapherotrites archaeon]
MGQKTSKESEILDFVSQQKAFIDSEALKLLSAREDWQEIVSELIKENEFFIRAESIEKKAVRTKIGISREEQSEHFEKLQVEEKCRADETSTEFHYRIMSEYDVTNQSFSQGKIEDFLAMFRDKFLTLKKMIQAHHSLSPVPISRIRAIPAKEQFDLIGMVARKWQTKNGHTAIELEDLEKSCIAVISKNERSLEQAREKIMLDDVVGIRAEKISNEMVIVKELYWADLPQRKMKRSKHDTRIASISDLHVGSKLFLETPFRKFVEWINCEIGNENERREVKKIKYLVVAGDNVDGIGIYPSQYAELSIKNIFEQYAKFSDLILQIPKEIQIFIIPGQHDAVRWADPQPAIPEKLVPKLYAAENVHLLGSPSWVEIEGFKAMIYHGSGLHTLFSSISGLSYLEPQKAIVELLKKRDFMPAYGVGHTYVPEKRDYLLVREEPDLVFIGDLHHAGYTSYRGTMIINNGTWQGRTDYQVKLGHVPTPGIVPVINLKTGNIIEKQFIESEPETETV